MSSAEFTEWLAYQRIEPSYWEMENWRFAQLSAAVVNAVHSTIPIPKGKHRPKPLKPKDFYPVIREE